jgi:biopolymer transport protein ExbB
LSATIVGLAVAIPALVAFSYFSRRVELLAVEMESLVTDLIEKLYQKSRNKAGTQEDGEATLEEVSR